MDTHRPDDRVSVQAAGLSRREALLRVSAGSLALALLARGVGLARAQEGTPEPGLPEGVNILPVVSVRVDDMPPAPVQVTISRLTLEPGASSPVSTLPFPGIGVVEQGTLTCPGGAPRYVVAPDGTVREFGDEEVPVNTGEAIYIPANVPDGARNDGTEQVVVLLVDLPPAEMGGTPAA